MADDPEGLVITVIQKLPVVAAIPNYNMAESLDNLLPQVLAQGYDHVFVLDDASTDHTVDVVGRFGADVTLVRSPRNRGAGANRNQILDQVDDDTLIHFIDADMDIASADTAAKARDIAQRHAPRGVGLIGGLVSRVDGHQEPYNYGPVFSLRTNLLTGGFPPLIDRFRNRPRVAAAIGRVGRYAMREWPRIYQPPTPADAYWVHEGNMLIHARLFRSVGGYDPMIREHEAQDLALSLNKIGVAGYFDPSIRVIHHHVDVRGKFRIKRQAKDAFYLIRKHGVARYLTDR